MTAKTAIQLVHEDGAEAALDAYDGLKEFKMGDRVKVVGSCQDYPSTIGKFGTIVRLGWHAKDRPALLVRVAGQWNDYDYWPEDLEHAD